MLTLSAIFVVTLGCYVTIFRKHHDSSADEIKYESTDHYYNSDNETRDHNTRDHGTADQQEQAQEDDGAEAGRDHVEHEHSVHEH